VQPVKNRRAWWRSAKLCVPLVALTAAAVLAQPAAALSPGSNGSNLTCFTPAPASVSTQFTNPKQIDGSASLECPAPGNNSPGGFGPTGGPTQFNNPPPPVDGTPCQMVYRTPVLIRNSSKGTEFQDMEPANVIAPDSTPNFVANPWRGGYFGVSTVVNPFPSDYISGDEWLFLAGHRDYFTTWTYNGTWKKQPDGSFKCMALNTGGWSMPCSGKSLIVQCFDFVTQTVVPNAPPPPLPPGFDANAFLKGLVFAGNISSIPQDPHPGVTNLPVCFYVSGMTINGQLADPTQDVWWEQIVLGPPVDPQGRSIYFVFRIHVFYRFSEWSFGDQGTADLPAPGSADPLCPPRNGGQQLVASHTYTQYSPGQSGFPVTVTHHFGIDVQEVWVDSRPGTQQGNPPQIPDVTIPSAPFAKTIVQEEGVPVGG
jgi:hypothetical protein